MEYVLDRRNEDSIEEMSEDCSIHDELGELSGAFETAVHPSAALPLPFGIEEKPDEVIFIDPSSGAGKRILSDPETRISDLFALLRQFVAPVCNNIGLVVNEMLCRNTGVNDIDVTTGMTMLHYVVRAECISTDKRNLMETLQNLLLHGAYIPQRTMLTDMNALHIAAFFDCPESLKILIGEASLQDDADFLINSLCDEFDNGSPLHLAVANLGADAAEVLLKHGADRFLLDDLGRTPENCIPKHLEAIDEKKNAEKLKKILNLRNGVFPIQNNNTDGKVTETFIENQKLDAEGAVTDLAIGDTVLIGGTKRGGIRFIGPTKFAPGVWCGVELDEPIGKNNGSINGIRYFTCEPTKGVFAPLGTVVRVGFSQRSTDDHVMANSKENQKPSRQSLSSAVMVKSKADHQLKVGMTVRVEHLKVEGKVRFIGETDFASGTWIGLSLRRPLGKNNGTVQGREYFRCKAGHGIMLRPPRVSVNRR